MKNLLHKLRNSRLHLVLLVGSLAAGMGLGSVRSASAENLSINEFIVIEPTDYLTWQYRGDLDCPSELYFSIGDETQLKERFIEVLSTRGISIISSAPVSMSLYVTEVECGRNGESKESMAPGGLAGSETAFAYAYVRVIVELTRRSTGELIDSTTFLALGTIEQSQSHTLWFQTDKIVTEVSLEQAWTMLSKTIVEHVKAKI